MKLFGRFKKKKVIQKSIGVQKKINDVAYTIHSRKRTRGILVSVDTNGNVKVSKHPRISIEAVEKAVLAKYSWIVDSIKKQTSRPKKLLAHYSVKDFKDNKEKARILVKNRLLYFNQFYKYKIGKVYIRNQKSRWGSCSARGNLNFNYKIIFLPSELADYIIVHELCHLKEMNHSVNFWALVSQTISQYKILRKNLRLY